jgi:hypothetical protein
MSAGSEHRVSNRSGKEACCDHLAAIFQDFADDGYPTPAIDRAEHRFTISTAMPQKASSASQGSNAQVSARAGSSLLRQ